MDEPLFDLFEVTIRGRRHQLPPYWDGQRVDWGDEFNTPPVFVCPPPKPVQCSGCGSLQAPATAIGVVGAARPRHSLHLSRCPACGRDEVAEFKAGTQVASWVLDESDYTDLGSHER